jgi:hypothetical protein
VLALVALITVPVTTSAGHWLRKRVADTPLIERHEHLGGQLLPWVIALFIITAAAWLVSRRTEWDRALPLRIGIAVVVTVIAAGATVQTVRIGESGSKAVWQGNVADQSR